MLLLLLVSLIFFFFFLFRFDLFRKYQTTVHREDVSKWKPKDFSRFLCSGLKRSSERTIGGSNNAERKLGSYHQCYRLDGKLVAVGVIDLIPNGVSSVYVL